MRKGLPPLHIRVCMFFSCNQPAEDLVRECEVKASKRSRDALFVNRLQKASKTPVRYLVGMKSWLDDESMGIFVSVSVFVPDGTRWGRINKTLEPSLFDSSSVPNILKDIDGLSQISLAAFFASVSNCLTRVGFLINSMIVRIEGPHLPTTESVRDVSCFDSFL